MWSPKSSKANTTIGITATRDGVSEIQVYPQLRDRAKEGRVPDRL